MLQRSTIKQESSRYVPGNHLMNIAELPSIHKNTTKRIGGKASLHSP